MGNWTIAIAGSDTTTMRAVLSDATARLRQNPRVTLNGGGWETDSAGRRFREFVAYDFRGPAKLADRVASDVVAAVQLPGGYKVEARNLRAVVASRSR
jgi:hypothetical protein